MNKRVFKSLSIKLPLLFVISVIIIMIVEIPLVYSRFHGRMLDQYTRMARGVTQLMVNAFDGDKVEEYIEKNFDLPEYKDTVDYFYTLRDNYPDILYMYVYRFQEDGGHVIIDLDADWWENGEGYAPGYLWSLDEIEEPFASHLSEIMEGKEIAGYSEHTREDGYLFTYTRPIFRSDGSYACTASVDFSMDYLSNMDISFTLKLTLILLGIGAIVLLLDILFVRNSITHPINELSVCAGKFAYDTEEDRKKNIELLEGVKINTADEIEDVYHMLLSVTRDSFLATTSLTQAKQDIQDRDEQLSEMSIRAYKDMLTGVGNLTAYKQAVKLLKKDIQEGNAEFGLVVFDLNDLKLVNDSCGHSYGDAYIRGGCKTICKIYKHSPVFRIGGDEFVVVLREEDYRNREALIKEICLAFENSYSKKTSNAWEKYSASCGMAVFGGQACSVEEVFKQADDAMYDAKRRFKENMEPGAHKAHED